MRMTALPRLAAAVAALAPLFAASPLDAATETVDGITWTYTVTNGEASVGSGLQSSKAVPTWTTGAIAIPDTLGGYPVTKIGEWAFNYCERLTNVTIPASVTSIESYAFSHCKWLTSVTIPDSVTSIKAHAFMYCSGLTSVTIPDSVTSIGNYAFLDCSSLESVSIGANVKNVQQGAFGNCGKLEAIVVDSSNSTYKSSGGLLLSKDGKTLVAVPGILADITIPSSVASIGSGAFYRCCNLKSVVIPNSVKIIGGASFAQSTNLASMTIPNSVTGIKGMAFDGCRGLTSVTIPDSVTSIGDYAFRDCSGLLSFSVDEANPKYKAEEGLLLTKEGKTLICGINREEVVIPDGATSVGSYAFSHYDRLKNVIIPDSVTNISSGAFWCSGLARVTIPDSVASIGNDAFYYCSGLTNIVFMGDSPAMGKDVFEQVSANCTAYVLRGSTGWGVEIPGTWKGINIAYLDDEPSAGVAVSVTAVRQRWPWNGLVDIDCTVTCADPAADILLSVTARDAGSGADLPVRTVRLENGAFGGELRVRAGDLAGGQVRLVWDAGADLPEAVVESAQVEVTATVAAPNADATYLVIDLSGGANATSYPVTELSSVPAGGWTDEYKTTKLVLRKIPAGTFTMGCGTGEVGYYGYEAVPHPVTISKPFYMGVFEVTQRQYELVMGSRPSYFSNASYYTARPVEQVSYNDIRGSSSGAQWPSSSAVDSDSFMGRIRSRTGRSGFDLPTEAQWEYACRAGTTTALNSGKNLTSIGQDANMDEVGRYWYNGGSSYRSSCDTSAGTAKVGSYLPNAWGLYDMHGNVWEWTLDWWQGRDSFSSSAATDPVGPASGSNRVERGGSWGASARSCRSAFRNDYDPSGRYNSIGFRLCCSAGL